MSHGRLVTIFRRSLIICMASALAVFAGGVPASLAQVTRGLDQCKSARTGSEGKEPQVLQGPGSNASLFIAVPTGRVCVAPEVVDGGPGYVRRTTAGEGIAIVEVSNTPFLAALSPGQAGGGLVARADQPASW